jgi:glycosyltransferase involved in cell wall biosynthesis
MFSIVVATRDSERTLVPTLAALVPGATAGIVREVVVADAGSADATEEVADIAGCRFISMPGPLGARLQAAVKDARGDWLMFLRAGAVPGPTWIDEVMAFCERDVPAVRAAVFSAEHALFSMLRRQVFLPRPEQGLILRKSHYAELGRHRADAADAEKRLLQKLGRGRITHLRTTVTFPDI